MNTKRFLVWLGVAVVLCGCLIGSCLLAGLNFSARGREFWRDAWREAGRVGGEEERLTPNETYNLSFGEDGAVYFGGGGVELKLPPGYVVKFPEGRPGEAPPFEYFMESDGGDVQIRLRREENVPGGDFSYGGDEKLLFAHAKAYAERLAGKAALEAAPPAYVAASRLGSSLADAAVEGCYRYTAGERERQRYDGEYFVFLGRGYDNVVLASVAFKPFAREKALARGRELTDGLRFK